jgi:hypothetical protein
LKYLNDYAGQRYNDIQTGIFRNGGRNYFSILKSLQHSLRETRETIADKYKSSERGSQWDSSVIFGLFGIIVSRIPLQLNLLEFLHLGMFCARRKKHRRKCHNNRGTNCQCKKFRRAFH